MQGGHKTAKRLLVNSTQNRTAEGRSGEAISFKLLHWEVCPFHAGVVSLVSITPNSKGKWEGVGIRAPSVAGIRETGSALLR